MAVILQTNGEYEKYSAMENKGDYKAPRRSLIVFHEASSVIAMIGKQFAEFNEAVDKIRELGLFDFVFADILTNYKDIGRDKALQKIFMDSNGVLLGNTFDSQMYIELNSKDIKLRDSLEENMGYIVENGKGYYSQMLQFTPTEEDEDEI